MEYDAAMMAPLGLVAMDIPEGCQVGGCMKDAHRLVRLLDCQISKSIN